MAHQKQMESPSMADQRRGVLLERLFLCASSALASAFFSFTYWRRRTKLNKESKLAQGHKPSQQLYTPDPAVEQRERDLLSARSKIKNLEASMGKLQYEKCDLETDLAELDKDLAAATKAEDSLKQQLSNAKAERRQLLEQLKCSQNEARVAQKQAKELQKAKDDLQRALADSTGSVSGIQHSLAAQTAERKAAERKVKELEVGLSSALASKGHIEAESRKMFQKLEAKLKAAESARAQAEADLLSFKERMELTRTRVTAIAEKNSTMQKQLEKTEAALLERTASLKQERQRRATLEPQMLKRVRELEAELKITRETARNQMRRTSSRGSIDSQLSQHTG